MTTVGDVALYNCVVFVKRIRIIDFGNVDLIKQSNYLYMKNEFVINCIVR